MLWSGALPATMPVTAAIFGLALWTFFITARQNTAVTRLFRKD